MSTYTDLHNKAKETLNVDYHTRITPQKAHFLNPENSFHGTFVGEGHFKGKNHISGGIIDHVYLSTAVLDDIKFKNGINLDDVVSKLDQIGELCANLQLEQLERINADTNISNDLTQKIDIETERAIENEIKLNNELCSEISNRISADVKLKKDISKKIIHDRHFEMLNHDNRVFPIKLNDYAINTYIDNNPDAYVYVNNDTEKFPIGKIENIKLDENGNLKSFAFNAFADHPKTYELTAAGKFKYEFDKETTTIYTGVGGYRLSYDALAEKQLDEAQFILDSANRFGYYNAYFNDSRNIAATINGNCKTDADGNLSSCLLNITSPQLSNFKRVVPYEFTKNNQTLHFTGADGNSCEITLHDNMFQLYDQHIIKYYLPVKQNGQQFAKIFKDDGFKFDDDNQLTAVKICFDENAVYELLRSNDFKAPYSKYDPFTYVQYNMFDNAISVIREYAQYKYVLNNDNGTIVPGHDKINKRIDDDYEHMLVELTIPSTEIGKYVNDTYVLTRDKASNIYVCEKEITEDNFGKITLIFNKDEHNLIAIVKQKSSTDAFTLRIGISDIAHPQKIGKIKILKASSRICNDIYDIQPEELIRIDSAKFEYSITADLSHQHHSGEAKVLVNFANSEKKDVIDVLMPNKEIQIPYGENASSKFILNFKIIDRYADDNKFVKLNILSHCKEDKFYYFNKQITNVFILKNKFSALQFEEIRPHRYIITDLNCSEIDWRLKQLHDRLESDEISVAIEIDALSGEIDNLSTDVLDLSSEISTAIQRNRDDVSFFGDVTLSDKYDEHDIHNHLSDLIATNPDTKEKVQYGFMYRCKAPVGREMEQFWIWNDDAQTSAFLKDNMYFVVNRKSENDTIPLNELKYNDVAFFNNFDIDVANLSAYAKQIELSASQISSEVNRLCSEISNDLTAKYEKLTADDNFISGEVDRLCSEISNDLTAKYSDLTTTVSSLCTTVSTDFVNRLSANDILGYNKFIGDVSAANVSVENEIISNLTAGNVEFTNLTVHGELVIAEQRTDAIISHLSATSADIDVANVLSSNLTFASIAETAVGNLSIDSNNLKLVDRMSSLNEELSDLEAKTDFLLSVGHRSMEYFNDVRSIQYATHENADLSDWLKDNFNDVAELSGGLKQGFMFRLSAEQKLYKPGSEAPYVVFDANDCFIVKHDIRPLDDAKFEDFAVIYDAQTEGKKLCADLSVKIDNLELSAADISAEVNRLCAEISNDLTAKYDKFTADDSFISGEVGRLCSEISNDLTAKYDQLSRETSRLCSEISNDLTAKYDKLTADDNFISGEVDRLCSEISNDLTAKYDWLSDEISSNDDDIRYLSSELSDYHNTLSGIDRKEHSEQYAAGHIYSDNLIVTDLNTTSEGEGKHNRYYMTMDYGTIVMRKIED